MAVNMTVAKYGVKCRVRCQAQTDLCAHVFKRLKIKFVEIDFQKILKFLTRNHMENFLWR